MLRPALALILAFGLACTGGEEADAPEPTPGPIAGGADPTPAADPLNEAPEPPEELPAEAPAKSGGSPSHVTAEQCAHPCTLLQTYPFQYVQDNYCQLCGPHDGMACEFDWPTNDVPTCDIWDFYRNCIYADQGYPFKSAEWKERFGEYDWYTPDPDFSEDRLSATAKANVEYFKRARKEKIGCAG